MRTLEINSEQSELGNLRQAENPKAFLKVVVPLSDPPLVECPEASHRVVVGVFGQIVDPETKDNVSTFEETIMGATRTQNPRMTPKVHMLIHNVPE